MKRGKEGVGSAEGEEREIREGPSPRTLLFTYLTRNSAAGLGILGGLEGGSRHRLLAASWPGRCG